MNDIRKLSRVFSTSFLLKLSQNEHLDELNELVENHKRLNRLVKENDYRRFYNELYLKFSKEYKFEYIYKNEVYYHLHKKYNIGKDDGILTEVKSGTNIADLVYLNGTSKVYEIKTEIDTNKRLLGQIKSYSKLFKEVTVVTYQDNVEKVLSIIPEYVGVMVLVRNGEFEIVREAIEHTDDLDRESMFKTLRRKEYESVVLSRFGELPDVNDSRIYEACLDKFNELSVNNAHDAMISQLKLRSNKSLLRKNRKWPKSIYFLIENSNLKKYQRENLLKVLN